MTDDHDLRSPESNKPPRRRGPLSTTGVALDRMVAWVTFDRAKAVVLIMVAAYSLTFSCRSEQDADGNIFYSLMKGWIDKKNIDSMLKFAREYEREAQRQRIKAEVAMAKIRQLEEQIKDKAEESAANIAAIELKYSRVLEDFHRLQRENQVLLSQLESRAKKNGRVTKEILARKEFGSQLEEANRSATSLSTEITNLKEMSQTITAANWLRLAPGSEPFPERVVALPASDVTMIKKEIQEVSRHQMALRGLLEQTESESTRFKLVKEMALARSYLRYLKKVHDFRLRFTDKPIHENLIPARYTSQIDPFWFESKQPYGPFRPGVLERTKAALKTGMDSLPEL